MAYIVWHVFPHRQHVKRELLITGRNKVVAKVIFLHLAVILFTGGWGCLPQCPPQEQTPVGADPQGSDTPLEQTHPRAQTPSRADTPPRADAPLEQTQPTTPPRTKYTPTPTSGTKYTPKPGQSTPPRNKYIPGNKYTH